MPNGILAAAYSKTHKTAEGKKQSRPQYGLIWLYVLVSGLLTYNTRRPVFIL